MYVRNYVCLGASFFSLWVLVFRKAKNGPIPILLSIVLSFLMGGLMLFQMFDDLKHSTKKPTSILEKFSMSVVPFQKFDIENAEFSSEYELREWIIQLCCLIPIQIAVARNNLFLPLRLSSNEIDQAELDDSYGHHVNSVAKNISFGWYEGILKYSGDKKVKVVSSMGEKSCGKSFMLNHLVETTFDGSAMVNS
jgi:hypothetical protein